MSSGMTAGLRVSWGQALLPNSETLLQFLSLVGLGLGREGEGGMRSPAGGRDFKLMAERLAAGLAPEPLLQLPLVLWKQ